MMEGKYYKLSEYRKELLRDGDVIRAEEVRRLMNKMISAGVVSQEEIELAGY